MLTEADLTNLRTLLSWVRDDIDAQWNETRHELIEKLGQMRDTRDPIGSLAAYMEAQGDDCNGGDLVDFVNELLHEHGHHVNS